MKTVKTARGQKIDMGALARQNEKSRAVSNVPINAKGDIIDSRGSVVKSREQVKKEIYAAQELPKEKNKGIKEDPLDAYNDDRMSTRKDVETMTQDEILDELAAQSQEVSRKKRKRKDGSEYYEIEYEDGSIVEENINK